MNLQGSNSGTEVESSAPSSNTRRLSRRLAELSKTSNHEWLDALRDRCLYKRILATRALTELGLFDARLKRALFLNLSDSAPGRFASGPSAPSSSPETKPRSTGPASGFATTATLACEAKRAQIPDCDPRPRSQAEIP
jgi:hypothetical protein